MTGELQTEANWLERMHAFLTWKVVGLDFKNPYERRVSDKVLAELAESMDSLKKVARARGLMDGEEIIVVKNLKELLIESDHPSLSKLRKADLERYLGSCNVQSEWDRQLADLQQECRTELDRRRAEASKRRREY